MDKKSVMHAVGLEDEFALVAQLFEARRKAQLTQDEVAKRMGTSKESAPKGRGFEISPP